MHDFSLVIFPQGSWICFALGHYALVHSSAVPHSAFWAQFLCAPSVCNTSSYWGPLEQPEHNRLYTLPKWTVSASLKFLFLSVSYLTTATQARAKAREDCSLVCSLTITFFFACQDIWSWDAAFKRTKYKSCMPESDLPGFCHYNSVWLAAFVCFAGLSCNVYQCMTKCFMVLYHKRNCIIAQARLATCWHALLSR